MFRDFTVASPVLCWLFSCTARADSDILCSDCRTVLESAVPHTFWRTVQLLLYCPGDSDVRSTDSDVLSLCTAQILMYCSMQIQLYGAQILMYCTAQILMYCAAQIQLYDADILMGNDDLRQWTPDPLVGLA
eukprot:3142883-Rhodomonas_salina.1